MQAALTVAMLVAQGCATARNYDDPSGPIFVGRQATVARAGRDLKLVTFNIKFGEHPDAAIQLLASPGPLHDPDVLVLQEMDVPGTEHMARALGMNYVYVPSAVHPSSHRDIGVAILSPWPVDDARKVLLPHEHRTRKMKRAAATATIRTPVGVLRVYAVHLETPWGASGADRRAQARAILNDAAGWPGAVVIAGDFNGAGGADELAKASFVWLTRAVHNTAWLLDADHILVRGLCAAGDPPAAKVSDVRNVSDHRPVWAMVRPCSP